MNDDVLSGQQVGQTLEPQVPSPGAGTCLRGMDLQERLKTRLEKVGGDAAVQRFDRALRQFMWEEVPIDETRAALTEVLALVDEVGLRMAFAPFLDARLGFGAADAEAKTALCEIVGIPAMMRTAELSRESKELIEEMWAAVMERWADQPVRARDFLGTFSKEAEPGEETKKRGKLWLLVKVDEEVRDILRRVYQQLGSEEDEDYCSGPAFG